MRQTIIAIVSGALYAMITSFLFAYMAGLITSILRVPFNIISIIVPMIQFIAMLLGGLAAGVIGHQKTIKIGFITGLLGALIGSIPLNEATIDPVTQGVNLYFVRNIVLAPIAGALGIIISRSQRYRRIFPKFLVGIWIVIAPFLCIIFSRDT